MKISELIKELEEIQDDVGDVNCYIWYQTEDQCGFIYTYSSRFDVAISGKEGAHSVTFQERLN